MHYTHRMESPKCDQPRSTAVDGVLPPSMASARTLTRCAIVAAEAPSFIRSPPPTVKIAEEQSALLRCDVVGTPSPDIAWKTVSPPGRVFPLFHDDPDAERFVMNSTGDLLIQVAGRTRLRIKRSSISLPIICG